MVNDWQAERAVADERTEAGAVRPGAGRPMSPKAARRVLVLLGAGSAVFTRGLLADVMAACDLGPWCLRLVDVNGEALEVAARLATRMVDAQGRQGSVSLETFTDRREALQGAAFVVSCIGVGGREAWGRDWDVARRYGIYQSVGDSVLPGGLSRAMRTVPVLVEIANDIARYCPDALFFNYSNPMTANCYAVTKAGVDVVGLCHGVFHTHQELAQLVGARLSETSVAYCGINHLTFIYDMRLGGEPAWPLLRDKIGEARHKDPFSWELFERLGVYPAPGDRHTTEFFPERFAHGEYYGKTLGVDAFSLKDTIDKDQQRYDLMRSEAMGETDLDLAVFDRSDGEQEQLIGILRSICTGQPSMVSGNVPNRGLVRDLPPEAVLEVPCLVGAGGARAVSVPHIPAAIAGILQRRLAPVPVVVEAALTGDRELFAEALILDGAVSDPAVASAMADDFVTEQRAYLPLFS